MLSPVIKDCLSPSPMIFPSMPSAAGHLWFSAASWCQERFVAWWLWMGENDLKRRLPARRNSIFAIFREVIVVECWRRRRHHCCRHYCCLCCCRRHCCYYHRKSRRCCPDLAARIRFDFLQNALLQRRISPMNTCKADVTSAETSSVFIGVITRIKARLWAIFVSLIPHFPLSIKNIGSDTISGPN